MRTIKYIFLGLVGLALLLVAVANRGAVSLKLIPQELADVVGMNFEVSLPLFSVILGGVVVGLLIGFVWEWLREHKHRRDVVRKTREVSKLEREVKTLKKSTDPQKDEVLALLE
ncbi:MAG: LapA family protein [Brevirhabdus sp.]